MANLHTQLSHKTLAMIVGPAAIGKSTIMQAACAQDNRFSYVQSFTTRPDRQDGKSTYRHITEQTVQTLTANGSIVTSLRHPTTGYIYGTTVQSYPGEYNLLDTLSGSVELYRDLPFERSISVSLTADPDDWQSWILGRYPRLSEERTNRLQEAIMSIEWSLAQTHNHYWLVNRPGHLSDTAKQLIDTTLGPTHAMNTPPQAHELLSRAKLLLSYD